MCNTKVLAFLVGIVYSLFVYFLFSGNTFEAECFSALILPILTLGYFCGAEKKSIYFIAFLVLYSISDLMVIVSDVFSDIVYYFVGNSLYILAYVALVIEISKSLNLKEMLKHYKFSILVLLLLDSFIAYSLLDVVDPYLDLGSEYFIEITYNISMLLILSLALLNYFHQESRKAFYLLIGAICIVFSEVLNVAYMYVSHQNLLSFLTITLALVGFFFLYQQTKLKYKKSNPMY
ncbi:hypothetical protein [Algibacter sp. 2305UL17-15]|uniref:hypothetical protein n=1 Tax=Algibacter sp. 2305UL17-15 TaxID=3231268 RepID=UPI00345900B5